MTSSPTRRVGPRAAIGQPLYQPLVNGLLIGHGSPAEPDMVSDVRSDPAKPVDYPNRPGFRFKGEHTGPNEQKG